MSDRISVDFLAARLAALQDSFRDFRDSQEGLADRVTSVETTLSNMSGHLLRHAVVQERRLGRVERRLDAQTLRLERLEEAQFRMGDMLSDTRQDVQQVAAEQARMSAEQARMAAEQARMAAVLDEVLRRLPAPPPPA